MNHSPRQHFLTVALVAMVTAAPGQIAMAMPDVSAFRNAVEVSDLELGQLRGRYVGRGQILYFGVEMNTEWRTANGELFRAGLSFGVDRHHGRFKPVITVVNHTEVVKPDAPVAPAGASASAPAAPISSGGLDTVKGVGQVVQVTGDTNSVRNDINVSLRTGSEPRVDAPEEGSGPSTASTSSSDSGAVVQAGNDNRSLGVSVVVPGQGTATQSITALSGLRQNVRLTGDMNSVLNQLNLTAEFKAVSNPGIRHIRSSFQTMRGLPQAGQF